MEDYKEKYETLCEQYGVLSSIIENSADAFWICDRDGRCIRVNAAYERLIGLPRERIVGVLAKDWVGSVVSEVCSDRMLKTKKPVTILQEFFLTGKVALVTATPVFNKQGEVIMGICNDRDVNVLHRLREQLIAAQKQASTFEMQANTLKRGQLYSDSIVAEDPRTKELLEKARKVARTDSTVLITGNTGVGKEVIAKFIHRESSRAEETFVRINCGAISPELIESELFGYEKGAFTGANSTGKLGLFEVANHGSVFLDEISELPLHMQVKLLRVLQEREITRVGGTKSIQIDIRIIAATNKDLWDMMERNLFRADLYYRLNVFPLHVLPLRERPDDILPLAKLFLAQLNTRYNSEKAFSNGALKKLLAFEWPGNVRELRNAVEHAFISAEGSLLNAKDLQFDSFCAEKANVPFSRREDETLQSFLTRIEYAYLSDAYEQCGNVRDAAKLLGISPATFVRKRSNYQETFGQE